MKEKLNKELPFIVFAMAQTYGFGEEFQYQGKTYQNSIDVTYKGSSFNYPAEISQHEN